MALNGWHIGERAIHAKLKHVGDPSIDMLYSWISGDLDPYHAEFHSTKVPFLPVTMLDVDGRPWGSVLAAEDGKPGNGFIRHVKYTTLDVRMKVWVGDPFLRNVELFREGEKMLVSGLGIEFETRRRNKFAGWVSRMNKTDAEGVYELEFTVNQSLGNCPKYINARSLIPHPNTNPQVKYQNLNLDTQDRLPDELIDFIHDSDTVFLGTTYAAPSEDAQRYPSHLGMNQRGGRAGFVRVSKKDGRTVVLPDYSGNRFMTSLGNIEATPLASLTFLSFTDGSILYLTGIAKNHLDDDAKRIMPMHTQHALTTLSVTGYSFVLDALPVRQAPGTLPQRSPYSPPVRYLAEEEDMIGKMKLFGGDSKDEKPVVLLTRIELHSPTIATYYFDLESSADSLRIEPGQAIILDFSSFLGKTGYAHMAPGRETSVNDDRIRTWTVSSTEMVPAPVTVDGHAANGGTPTSKLRIALTMREKPGGIVTGALFSLARRLASARPEMMRDLSMLRVKLDVVGITGEFALPASDPSSLSTVPKKYLWIAGGIGLTPFLSMLRAVVERCNAAAEKAGSSVESSGGKEKEWDIRMVLSTREPEVMVPLVAEAYGSGSETLSKRLLFSLDVFTNNQPVTTVAFPDEVRVGWHPGRVDAGFFRGADDLRERDVYLCGPKLYEQGVLEGLGDAGADVNAVKREGFEY